jgi:hypothetical protein
MEKLASSVNIGVNTFAPVTAPISMRLMTPIASLRVLLEIDFRMIPPEWFQFDS